MRPLCFFCTQKVSIMEYLVFPFGKYKGTKLEDLPSTYIVLALEKFELPDELSNKMWQILLGRIGVYSAMKKLIVEKPKKDVLHVLEEKINELENLES